MSVNEILYIYRPIYSISLVPVSENRQAFICFTLEKHALSGLGAEIIDILISFQFMWLTDSRWRRNP